jgi:hypothetical protein
MPTVLDVLGTHFFVPDEIVAKLEQALARVTAVVPNPVIQGPDRPKHDQNTDTQPDEPIALTGRAKAIVEALSTPSPGYEPLLMEAGWSQFAARGVAKLAVRHGRRRAEESKWQRGVVDAIRFLARRKRQRRAILSRAKYLFLQTGHSAQRLDCLAGAGPVTFSGLPSIIQRTTSI